MIRISHMFSIAFFLVVFKSISFVTLCLFLSSIQFLSYFSSFPVSFFHSVHFFIPFLFLFPVFLLPFFSFCVLSFSSLLKVGGVGKALEARLVIAYLNYLHSHCGISNLVKASYRRPPCSERFWNSSIVATQSSGPVRSSFPRSYSPGILHCFQAHLSQLCTWAFVHIRGE